MCHLRARAHARHGQPLVARAPSLHGRQGSGPAPVRRRHAPPPAEAARVAFVPGGPTQGTGNLWLPVPLSMVGKGRGPPRYEGDTRRLQRGGDQATWARAASGCRVFPYGRERAGVRAIPVRRRPRAALPAEARCPANRAGSLWLPVPLYHMVGRVGARPVQATRASSGRRVSLWRRRTGLLSTGNSGLPCSPWSAGRAARYEGDAPPAGACRLRTGAS